METSFVVEPVNLHEYLLHWTAEGQTGESLFHANPDFLAEVGLESFDEQRIVEETADYLAERQPIIDFPQTVDLEEIAAAYGDFAEQLKARLEAS